MLTINALLTTFGVDGDRWFFVCFFGLKQEIRKKTKKLPQKALISLEKKEGKNKKERKKEREREREKERKKEREKERKKEK